MTEMPPEPACPHVALTGSLEISGQVDEHQDVQGFNASVRVWCADCEEPFVWMGVEPGLSPQFPMCDASGQQLNAPLKPINAAEGFGEGLPSYHLRNQVGQLTLQDRTEMITRIAAVIANPSLVTPRWFQEAPERWAARAVQVAIALKE